MVQGDHSGSTQDDTESTKPRNRGPGSRTRRNEEHEMTNPRDLFPDKMIFKVKGQKELPKWQREAIRRGVESESGPPESLRFQCRITTDANENAEGVKPMDGGTVTDHQNARTPIGEDHNDLPYQSGPVTH